MSKWHLKSKVNACSQENMTTSAVETFLREHQIPVLVENGGICPVLLQEYEKG